MAHYPISDIAKRLIEGRLILFVGAGMSMPYLPSWTGLLERLRDSVFGDDPDGKAMILTADFRTMKHDRPELVFTMREYLRFHCLPVWDKVEHGDTICGTNVSNVFRVEEERGDLGSTLVVDA